MNEERSVRGQSSGTGRGERDRLLEWGIGGLLLVVSLAPALFVVASAYELLLSSDWRVRLMEAFSLLVAAFIAWWCGATAWRLFTGRERRHGGLLSTPALVIGSVLCLAMAFVGMTGAGFSFKAAPGAVWFGGLGVAGLLLARLRSRRRTRSAG
jgi:hypothetical protein